MTIWEKQHAFICILVSLVIGANLSGLPLAMANADLSTPFSFISSLVLPRHNSATYPAPLPMWQFNEGYIILPQSATEAGLNRVFAGSTGNAWRELCSYQYDVVPEHKKISSSIDSLNAIFTLIKRQTCQHLDIPPPQALASL